MKKSARRILSMICVVSMLMAMFSFYAPVAQAADPWENKADVSWIDPSKKLVAITFDDGPVGTAPTASSQRIMNVLEKYGLHCTYFYWGEKIDDDNINEIRRAYSLGCELGNHSFTHPYLTNMNADQIKNEIRKTNDLLSPISGNEVTLVRPPYGSTNGTVSANVGAPMINWSLDSADWNNGNLNTVLNNLRRGIKDGSIVLCHQTYDFTAQAMEILIPELIEQGYLVVSVSELMKMKGVTMTAGTVYTNQAENKKNITNNGYENLVAAEEKIAALGEDSDAAAVAEARAAYDALTEAQKKHLSNYDALLAAEEAIAEADHAAANDVNEKIAAIGEVSRESEAAITEARAAYDALTDEQKDLVEGVDKLDAAEEQLAILKTELPFIDVSGWYMDDVRFVYYWKLMNGTADTLFSPDADLTRAQLVTILYRMEEREKVEFKGTFSDVPAGTWYSDAVEWAASEGIVNGVGDGTFKPDDVITREQIATILYRAVGEPKVEGDLSTFPDSGSVHDFAADALVWATQNGLINGIKSGDVTTLAPLANATRAQIAAIITRFVKLR